ncbi:hypothetical protein QWZ14_10760, partial [Paeniroseomonas aquatica]
MTAGDIPWATGGNCAVKADCAACEAAAEGLAAAADPGAGGGGGGGTTTGGAGTAGVPATGPAAA